MNSLLAQLTQPQRYQAMRRGIADPAGFEQWQGLLLLVGALVVLAVGLAVGIRLVRRARRASNSVQQLFRQALAVSGLSPEESRLLRRLARKSGAPHPTTMLLSPRLLAVAAARSVQFAPLPHVLREQYDPICLKLFAEHLPEVADEPSPVLPI